MQDANTAGVQLRGHSQGPVRDLCQAFSWAVLAWLSTGCQKPWLWLLEHFLHFRANWPCQFTLPSVLHSCVQSGWQFENAAAAWELTLLETAASRRLLHYRAPVRQPGRGEGFQFSKALWAHVAWLVSLRAITGSAWALTTPSFQLLLCSSGFNLCLVVLHAWVWLQPP